MKLINTLYKIFRIQTVYAHCDIPCGIYDPHQAQISALTVIRMIDIMHELENTHQQHDLDFRNNMIRAAVVKEDSAEKLKHEVRVIWGDYFKTADLAKYPELNSLVHEIMALASKTKHSVDREQGIELLRKLNRFAEIFWQTKSKDTKTIKAPYKPEEDIVIPVL